MSEKISEIIETLEKADQLFSRLEAVSAEARSLWDAGIEKLVGAIWVHEYKEREGSPDQETVDSTPATSAKLQKQT